jgi:hypothetical protein
VTPSDHRFFGDPAVRIKNVVHQAANKAFKSICDVGDYASALEDLANLIITNIKPGCLGAPLSEPSDPQCVVEDVQTLADGSESVTTIKACAKTGGAFPCWQTQASTLCPIVHNPLNNQDEQLGVVIERGPGGQPPPNTFARVFCSTIALKPGAADMAPGH